MKTFMGWNWHQSIPLGKWLFPALNGHHHERTLADKTVYENGLIDTSFNPPLFSIDSILKGTQDWDFFGFDFEICIISLLVMSKY